MGAIPLKSERHGSWNPTCQKSESSWKELRQILNKVPRDTSEQRTLRRLALGFETYIPKSDPMILTVTLESYAGLTGNDFLVVQSSDYMELWAKDKL